MGNYTIIDNNMRRNETYLYDLLKAGNNVHIQRIPKELLGHKLFSLKMVENGNVYIKSEK